ncbi:MAG TPA: T9SS type A sorting domain-containing protein [Ignavibacteria bacterium]|nr:T9SS type A sorting domain-containing protein [Ignavibacteria bacterium]
MRNNYNFKIILIFIAILFSGKIYSQTLSEENFDYPAGDSLGAHDWISFSGGATNVLTVVAPGLTFTNYPLSGIGNAVKVLNTGQDAYKNLVTVETSNSVYTSFMLKDSIARTGDYFFALLPSTSTTNYTGRVFIKDSLGMVSFGLSKSSASSGAPVYSAPVYSTGVTYVLVLKYTFNTGSTTDDELSLFVFTQPNFPSSEPSTATIGPITGTANDVPDIGRYAVRQGTAASSPTLFLDGFKVVKNWSKLVSVKTLNLNADNFSLSQNYPNPFNPSTKIDFSLPENGFVNLTIYNSLGKEVENLVNQNLNSGVYNYEFNGSKLNSGVYFYRLSFSNNKGEFFSDTKKLLLVK